MSDLPDELAAFLAEATASTWRTIAPLIPPGVYLAGGTALTVHLLHRISRDLDFTFPEPLDLVRLRETLERAGTLVVTRHDDDTLNCFLDDTRVQFLRAAGQHRLAPTTSVGAIDVASVEDITAMKLRVVLDRGELRDDFDLMEIDRRGTIPMEEGIALFLARYGIEGDDQRVVMLVRALGYLDDVADDPALPVARHEIERFWARRQPTLAANLSRY